VAVTANQSGLGSGPTDLTGLSISLPSDWPANRYIVVRFVGLMAATGGGGEGNFRIAEGATQLKAAYASFGSATDRETMLVETEQFSPTAGGHTYKVTGGKNAFNADLVASPTDPAFLEIEDVGPAGPPT